MAAGPMLARKIPIRVGDTVERDVERVRYVRKHLGDKTDIMVDINTRYTFLDLERALRGDAAARTIYYGSDGQPASIPKASAKRVADRTRSRVSSA